ncbi:hypothetical protein IFM58399_03025 [Aspergillus lentulus]|uniref:Uncharacterized protein n=1 Tax=Aspergillus lentulus TaxID=293939 RepID=A0AAN5YP92_ASPLE|nr:uncharacterized protein IFM58399_03025 [Aspergillus lentulus]KAF4154005.1 hypothetical protein CNMCM6069_000045 [Aspergillus lentulus]KAF4166602.1 hypothetical protein CNMCM6936_006309 [Aspergillus lentulus]KAF4173757.1 hypothetical protein CNMCM8060_009559 [Aspergillus lentulus]KAF4188098.1 hypothetical protein CNMCM7927_002590 [Aspergillus lentulus]KAF4192779.1 hypothetical protein CNMCM8694_009646 [Aspergillus lentulus]
MGIPQWSEQDERQARMQDAGLYIDWPNPYNLEPGLYIIVHMEYTTQPGEMMDVIDDAYSTVTARLESQQFRNPRHPIPGRKSLFIHYELINQDDGTTNPFPTEVDLFEDVQRHLMHMFDQLEFGGKFDLPYKLGPVRVFWCDMVEWDPELPTVTVEVYEETDSDSQEAEFPTVTVEVYEQADSDSQEAQDDDKLPESAQQ